MDWGDIAFDSRSTTDWSEGTEFTPSLEPIPLDRMKGGRKEFITKQSFRYFHSHKYRFCNTLWRPKV